MTNLKFSFISVLFLLLICPSFSQTDAVMQKIVEFDRIKGALRRTWVLIGGENDGWPIDISAEADSLRDSLKLVQAGYG